MVVQVVKTHQCLQAKSGDGQSEPQSRQKTDYTLQIMWKHEEYFCRQSSISSMQWRRLGLKTV